MGLERQTSTLRLALHLLKQAQLQLKSSTALDKKKNWGILCEVVEHLNIHFVPPQTIKFQFVEENFII